MKSVDLNLLVALDALLEEGTVTGAAERLNTSAPTMSRTLARLRRAFDDPILVRSGREMVATPRALAAREQVHALLEQATSLFTGSRLPDLESLTRTYTLQASDMIVGALALPLLAGVHREAPGVTIRFLSDEAEGPALLRSADLEIGVISDISPEIRTQRLLVDHMIVIVRPGHPLLEGELTAARLAAAQHLNVSRRGKLLGPLDERLAELGLRRNVVTVVPTWSASMQIVAQTDLVGLAPRVLSRRAVALLGLRQLPVPVELPALTIFQAWHARYESDAAHAWLRQRVATAAAAVGTFGDGSGGVEHDVLHP